MTCIACLYWNDIIETTDSGIALGLCRKNSPAVAIADGEIEGHPIGYWPVTLATDWCGDLKNTKSTKQ